MGSKDFIVNFAVDDRKRFSVETRKGKVVQFVVQFETFTKGGWLPVVRYDAAHGFAHKDILNRRGSVVEKITMTHADYKKALQFANSDIDSNWEIYKQGFLKISKRRQAK